MSLKSTYICVYRAILIYGDRRITTCSIMFPFENLEIMISEPVFEETIYKMGMKLQEQKTEDNCIFEQYY
jgi:hypothetical protein